jgi:mono/diheme cytochrome c family protein
MSEPTRQPPEDQPPQSGSPAPDAPAPDPADGPPERFDVSNLHAPIVREKLEPRDGFEPVPVWLVAVFGAFLFWGGWYVATYSGGWRADVLEAQPQARFLVAPEAGDRPVDPITMGRRVYMANCVACHQADGEGVPNTYPPLAQTELVTGPPARLKRIVLHGMDGPVTVRGQQYNAPMPAFGQRLNDQQIAALLTYIRQEWGNEASAIGEASVAATREATADRRTAWTASELLEITEDDFPDEATGVAGETPMPDAPDAGVPHAEPEEPEQ